MPPGQPQFEVALDEDRKSAVPRRQERIRELARSKLSWQRRDEARGHRIAVPFILTARKAQAKCLGGLCKAPSDELRTRLGAPAKGVAAQTAQATRILSQSVRRALAGGKAGVTERHCRTFFAQGRLELSPIRPLFMRLL